MPNEYHRRSTTTMVLYHDPNTGKDIPIACAKDVGWTDIIVNVLNDNSRAINLYRGVK